MPSSLTFLNGYAYFNIFSMFLKLLVLRSVSQKFSSIFARKQEKAKTVEGEGRRRRR